MTLCVYAIGSPVRGRIATTGLAGERLTSVREGSLAAVVGSVRRIPPPEDADLRRYDSILKSLSRRASALLPARYGTTMRDREEIQTILRSRQQSLRRQLSLVRGRVQMTVRIVHVSPVARTLLGSRGEPDKARPTTGREYLRTRALAQHVPEFDALRPAVRRWVRAERMETRGDVGTVYHLIPRGSVAAYRIALMRRASAEGMRVVISGPWPAYAFADPLD